MDDVCELSLILPAYNEAAGIADAVAQADDALRNLGVSYEIIVVDDGSSDDTASIIEQAMQARPRVRLVRHPANRGYGAALRTGFASARGDRIAFTDADGQFDLADLTLLLPLTRDHAIAVGYRADRQDSWLRKFYSRGYNLLAGALLGLSVRDVDCALKVFRRDALEKILPETDGFFVNTEMLTKAQQLGLTIAEVPVQHRPRRHGESKVSAGDIPRTLNTLLPFWWMNVMFPGAARETPRTSVPPGLQTVLMMLLFAVTCALFAGRLDHPLLEPEEARYAEIPRQMLQEGRIVTPILHGEDYWQKPPLLYWLVMVSYQIFGIHDWVARLAPMLAGIACVALTTAWGWRALGFWSGFVSGSILALSIRFLYLAGMLAMDGLLCAFVIAALACGHFALTDENGRKRWLILGALACGLGILTKGPVALVLILVPLAALAFLDRRCRLPTRWEACLFFVITALVSLPWYVAMAVQAPSAAGSFLWLHNLARYFSPIDHEKPAWFYAPGLLLGMLPWTLLLIPLGPYLWRKSLRAARRRPAALGFFLLAFAWCVLFFSLSGCKRPGYILPALPLLAMILGGFVTGGLPWARWTRQMDWPSVLTIPTAAGASASDASHRWGRRLMAATFGMAAVLSIAAALTNLWPWPSAGLAAGVFLAGAAAAIALPFVGPAWTSWAGCGLALLVLLGIGQRVWLPEYHDRFGLRRQVELLAEYEQEEKLPIATYPRRWDSISYYSRRTNVESYAPADFAQLIRDLQQRGKTIVFVRREESLRDLLKALPDHLEAQPLGRDDDFIVVALVRPRKR
ncbi:MAG: glycosyltransferase [Planctomycetes bacterium]|nr:glycosyltransferase [Planctomycetota bacterium]